MTLRDIVFGTYISGLGRTLDWAFYLIYLPCAALLAIAAVSSGPLWAALGACLLLGLVGAALVLVQIEKHGGIW